MASLSSQVLLSAFMLLKINCQFLGSVGPLVIYSYDWPITIELSMYILV